MDIRLKKKDKKQKIENTAEPGYEEVNAVVTDSLPRAIKEQESDNHTHKKKKKTQVWHEPSTGTLRK